MSMASAVSNSKTIYQTGYKASPGLTGRLRPVLFIAGSVVGLPVLILGSVFASVFAVMFPFAWLFGWL